MSAKIITLHEDNELIGFFASREEAKKFMQENWNEEYIAANKESIKIKEVDKHFKNVHDFIYDDSQYFNKEEELFNLLEADENLFKTVYNAYKEDTDISTIADNEEFMGEIDSHVEASIIDGKFSVNTIQVKKEEISKRLSNYSKWIKKNNALLHDTVDNYFPKYLLKGEIKISNIEDWEINIIAYNEEESSKLTKVHFSNEELQYFISHYTIDLSVQTKLEPAFYEGDI